MKTLVSIFAQSGLCILLFITSCDVNFNSTLNEQKKKEIRKEIDSIMTHFFNPNSLDYEQHIALRANTEGYLFAADGKIIFTDYQSYTKGVKSSFEDVQHFIELDNTKTYVFPLAIDAATCTTEFQGKYINTEGDTITHNGCWTFVFQKFDGEWKVIHENGTHIK